MPQAEPNDNANTSSNCFLSRCQPMPAPTSYSVNSAWRMLPGSMSAKAAVRRT
jgi:hypothetical protein